MHAFDSTIVSQSARFVKRKVRVKENVIYIKLALDIRTFAVL